MSRKRLYTESEFRVKRAAEARENRAWLKARGFCVYCGSRKARPGRVLCAPCAERQCAASAQWFAEHREQRRVLQAERVRMGLCTRCGEATERRDDGANYRLCARCREKAAKWQRDRNRRKWMEVGK